ncbi:uncharacterized protein [Montipora capricornis]|uniref:uncharacterized protein n=1 Tax=Montipora foliosa TaxID=591990 RepID=UPI0035F11122
MTSSDFTGLVINTDEDGNLENEDKEASFVLAEEGDVRECEGYGTTLQRCLFRIISSGALLKYVASASSLWVGSKWWSLVSVLLTLPAILIALIGEAVVVFYCEKEDEMKSNSTFCRKTRGDLRDLSVDEYHVYQFLRFLAVGAQVFCFAAMCISTQRSRRKPQILSLEEAHNLVKRKKWVVVNFQLVGFFILLVTSNVLNFCCSSKGACSCDAVGAMFYVIWAIVLWLGVLSCLVYATVINGAIAQAKQGYQQILDMDSGTVNDAIAIHQRICKISMQTIRLYHTWFLINSACYFWLIGYVAIVFLTQSTHMHSWSIFYHLSVCGVYCLFAFLHPWLSAARLTRAYSKLTRKLNTNFQWKPNHPFSDRSKLDSFLLYASNTQCQFSQITCSSSLPYISLFLALCGLGLKFFQ